MLEKKLLSILIPAYNKPDLLDRQLESILRQTYRPLEIIVLDDCSPISLESTVSKFSSIQENNVSFNFIRHIENLGVYWNFISGIKEIQGKFALFAPHDDWFIDDLFFSDAINTLENNLDCHIAIANSAIENTMEHGLNGLMMNLFSGNKGSEWIFLNGKKFIEKFLYVSLHPSYSSIMFDFEKLLTLGYLDLLVSRTRLFKISGGARPDFEPDEAFVSINLLASVGTVAVNGKVVNFRGTPPDSWSKSEFWKRSAGQGMFIPVFNLINYFKGIGFIKGRNLMIRFLINDYPISRISFVILKYLNFDKGAIFLMLLSFFSFLHKKITRFFVKMFKTIGISVFKIIFSWEKK